MDKEEFINVCMKVLDKDFPDEKQRYAVCLSKWEKGETDVTKFSTNTSQTILIFPRGKFYVEKYNDWFVFDDSFFNDIINTFQNSNLPKPFIDIDHQEGESLGEIIELLIDEEGLKGVVELNDLGKDLIKNKIYRYTSPHWGEITDNQGVKWDRYLRSVSLTNTPALLNSIPKLDKQLKFNSKEVKNMNKDFYLSQVTDEAIKKVVEDLIAQGEKLEEIVASLEKQLEETKQQLEEAQKENEELKKENEKMKEEAMEKEAEEFVQKQLSLKKIPVSGVDFWKKHYKANKDEVIKYFEVVNSPETEVTHKLSTKFKLSEEDVVIMKTVGLDANNEKDIQLYLKANKIGG